MTTTAAAAASATFGVCSTGQFSGDQSRLGRVSGSLKEPSRIASECQSGIFYGPDALPITSDGVLRHVSRLETSRDIFTRLCVGSVSTHSCLVLARVS